MPASVVFEDRLLSAVPEGWSELLDVPPVVNPALDLVLYAVSMTLPSEDPEAEPEVRVCPVANERLCPAFSSVGGFVCGAVARGSEFYLRFLQTPWTALALLVAFVVAVVLLVRRTQWRPGTLEPISAEHDQTTEIARMERMLDALPAGAPAS